MRKKIRPTFQFFWQSLFLLTKTFKNTYNPKTPPKNFFLCFLLKKPLKAWTNYELFSWVQPVCFWSERMASISRSLQTKTKINCLVFFSVQIVVDPWKKGLKCFLIAKIEEKHHFWTLFFSKVAYVKQKCPSGSCKVRSSSKVS